MSDDSETEYRLIRHRADGPNGHRDAESGVATRPGETRRVPSDVAEKLLEKPWYEDKTEEIEASVVADSVDVSDSEDSDEVSEE